MIEQALGARLQADLVNATLYPSLTLYPALTLYPSNGLGVDLRLYPYSAPDGVVFPYCYYYVVADPAEPDSFGNVDTGQSQVRFNIVTTTKSGKSIARSASAILNHLSGDVEGITVKRIDCTGVRDMQLVDGSYQWQFDARVEYVIP